MEEESSVEIKKPELKRSLLSFKSPPDPSSLKALTKRPNKRVKVLDEDEYVQKVEDIVERDFFPELKKLNAQAEYIEAAERQDHVTMNRLREQFSSTSSIHRQNDPLERLESPATFETPMERRREEVESEFGATPAASAADDKDGSESVAGSSGGGSKKRDKTGGVSLDKFMASHTSEDNESFYQLMEESESDFRRTHEWMFKKEEILSIENKSQQLALPSIEAQAALSKVDEKHSKPLDGWTYKNVNSVFYHPDGAPLTDQEKIELAKKERVVVHENTRFHSNPWKVDVKNSVLQNASQRKEANLGKVGVDGKELVDPTATPRVNGYSLLRIADPSPLLPPSESPLMTWGEVESTPYRLEGCDTPLPVYTGDGPSFKIQEVPKRDRLALELAEKNSRFYRDKKTKAIQQARASIKTPKTVGLSTRVATMSPAAQRLATSKLGIRLGTDKALRASYTPSPMRPSSSARKDATPSSVRSNISSLVRVNAGKGSATPSRTPASTRSVVDPTTLTDNLLNLPSSVKPRPKAADFL